MRKLVIAFALLAAACASEGRKDLKAGRPEGKHAASPSDLQSFQSFRPSDLPEPAEHSEAREQWLYEQRAYPFDSIPPDARRNALREVARMRITSTDAAESTWRELGPRPVRVDWPWAVSTGRVKALAVSSVNPDVVLAGSSSGGIWRSTDAGKDFTPVSDDHADLAVGAIAFAPSQPNTVYATMGSDFLGTGVLRSDDAGQRWRLVSGPTYGARGQATRIAVDPANAEHLFVAQFSRLENNGGLFSGGVLESNDGGATWTRRFAGLPADLVALPNEFSTLLAGMRRVDEGNQQPGIYRSTDAGRTWTPVFVIGDNEMHPRFGVTPAAPQRVYAFVFGYGSEGLETHFLRSDDGGTTWTKLPAAGLTKEMAMFVSVDPSNADVVYVGLRDLYRTTDGGQTFVNVTKGYTALDAFDPEHSTAHVDQHSLAFHPSDSSTVYLGNDGGVFLTHDRGETFESLSGTLSLVQAYGIAAHPTDPTALYLGTQDNGLERRAADGTWRELVTGDYGSVLFSNDEPDLYLTNYVFDSILVFRNDRYLGPAIADNTFQPGPFPFIAPFEHLRATNALYFGTWRLFRSNDFGRTWIAPADLLDLTKGNGDTLSAIAPSEHVLFTGSARGRVMRSYDDGATWTDVSAGLPDRSVRAIVIGADATYVGVSGYATEHVFVTRDGGATWQSMSDGLPDIPVNALLLRGGFLYAGTDIGVFRWSGARWTYFSNGMPPVIVTDFAVTADGRIVVATHGRGAYELVPAPARRRGMRH